MTFTCSCFSVLLFLRAAIFGVFGMTDGRKKSIRRRTVTNFLWWVRFYGSSPRSYIGPGCAVMVTAPSSECLRRVHCRGYVTSFDDVRGVSRSLAPPLLGQSGSVFLSSVVFKLISFCCVVIGFFFVSCLSSATHALPNIRTTTTILHTRSAWDTDDLAILTRSR